MDDEGSWLKMIQGALGCALMGSLMMRLLFGEHVTDALQVFGGGFSVVLAYGPFYRMMNTPFSKAASPKLDM